MTRFYILLAVIAAGLLNLVSPSAPADDAKADEAGFVSLFNGKDLGGWEGAPGHWSVVDGVLTGQTTKENPIKTNTFLIYRDSGVDDFELRFSYRIGSGNSGIQYRSEEFAPFRIKGYQADFEAGDTYSGINYEEGGRGILCPRGEKVEINAAGKKQTTKVSDSKKLQQSIKKNDWNDYVIIAQGPHLIHKINGQVMSETIDHETAKAKQHGLLALQLHAGPPMKAEFKDIRIKQLKAGDAQAKPAENKQGEKKPGQKKKIVLVAGKPSHGYGAHDFHAGVILLQKRLNALPGIEAVTHFNGWPKDPTAFDDADAVVLYMDGGGGHPVNKHLEEVQKLMRRGVGLMCMHYAVEVPAGPVGDHFKDWIGGYYESGFSINPHWTAMAELDTSHPIARGVKAFGVKDEWYYNMRFRDDTSGIKHILRAKPDDEARSGSTSSPRGPKKHIVDAKGRIETLMWAVERPDGGRGVGFTGGHFHKHWANDDYRKLVLNAIVWTAGGEVPSAGIESAPVSEQELGENNDEPKPKK